MRTENVVDFANLRKLFNPQQQQVEVLSNSEAQPRHVLSDLRNSRGCLATAQDISKLNQKRRRSYLQGRTPLEALLNDLATINVYHRLYEGRV